MSTIEVDFQIGQNAKEVIGGGGGLAVGIILELAIFGGLTGGLITVAGAAGIFGGKLFWERSTTIDQMKE